MIADKSTALTHVFDSVCAGKSASSRKMKYKDGKPISSYPDKGMRILPLSLIIVFLCGLSFYLGEVFCPGHSKFAPQYITHVFTKPAESVTASEVAPQQITSVSFPECRIESQDYTPCTDPRVYIWSLTISDVAFWSLLIFNAYKKVKNACKFLESCHLILGIILRAFNIRTIYLSYWIFPDFVSFACILEWWLFAQSCYI